MIEPVSSPPEITSASMPNLSRPALMRSYFRSSLIFEIFTRECPASEPASPTFTGSIRSKLNSTSDAISTRL